MTAAERAVWAAAFVATMTRDNDPGYGVVAAYRAVTELRDVPTARPAYISEHNYGEAYRMWREFMKEGGK